MTVAPAAGHLDQLAVAVVQRAHRHHDADLAGCGWPIAPRSSSRVCTSRVVIADPPASTSSRATRRLGLEQAGRQRAVGGEAGHRDVRRGGVRRHLAQHADVRRDGARVAARDRTGQGRVAGAQRVVERGAEQRSRAAAPARSTPHRRSRSTDSLTRVARWFDAGRERRVVQRAQLLLDPLRVGAHLDDQRLRDRAQRLRRGDAEARADQPGQVLAAAGERHGRVQRQRQRARPGRRVEHRDAVPAAGVHQQLAGCDVAGRGEALDQAGQHVVGHGQQRQLGGGQHLRRRQRPAYRAAARRPGGGTRH